MEKPTLPVRLVDYDYEGAVENLLDAIDTVDPPSYERPGLVVFNQLGEDDHQRTLHVFDNLNATEEYIGEPLLPIIGIMVATRAIINRPNDAASFKIYEERASQQFQVARLPGLREHLDVSGYQEAATQTETTEDDGGAPARPQLESCTQTNKAANQGRWPPTKAKWSQTQAYQEGPVTRAQTRRVPVMVDGSTAVDKDTPWRTEAAVQALPANMSLEMQTSMCAPQDRERSQVLAPTDAAAAASQQKEEDGDAAEPPCFIVNAVANYNIPNTLLTNPVNVFKVIKSVEDNVFLVIRIVTDNHKTTVFVVRHFGQPQISRCLIKIQIMEEALGAHIDNEDEIKEPQITSSDPNERKLARRLRIQRRIEAVRKQQLQEGVDQPIEVEKTLLDEQLITSAQQLEKLLLDGQELVGNVRVANDAREVKRREDQVITREERLKHLEEEDAESMRKFEAIHSKWEEISSSNDPLDIHYAMEEQKKRCMDLLDQKDRLIEDLKKELKRADDLFARDQRKQKDDLALLVQRIDNQVEVMQNAYRQELVLIEEAINIEHQQLLEVNEKHWENLYKEREKEEVNNMNKKFDRVAQFEQDMKTLNIEHQERYRESKIQLETDIEVLQQELEQVKALCLLNSEKLDYNYQVLKKRDEENIIMKAQQKRLINKLQDVVNSLKKKIARTENTTRIDTRRLTEEVVRLHRNITEIERKADHFADVNEKKYQEIWELNKDTASKLLEKILTIDRLIHEQQLGIPWTPPDQSLLEKTDLASFRSAMQVVADLFKEKEHSKSHEKKMKKSIEPSKEVLMDESEAEERLLKHILQRIADNSGFLIEDRLRCLLFPYREPEKTLVKIDNVFCALGITSEADVRMLKDYFIPYITCSVCKLPASPLQVEAQETELATFELTESLLSTYLNFSSGSDTASVGLDESHQMLYASHSEGNWPPNISEGSEKGHKQSVSFGVEGIFHAQLRQAKCHPGHPLTIDPIYVLKALRDFVAKFSEKKEMVHINMSSRLSQKRSTVSRLLTVEDVKAYWERFRKIFSPQREKVWDSFMLGLQKYHSILEERHKLNLETERLRIQNAELRRLLYKYLLSNENIDLHIPSRNRLPSLKKVEPSEQSLHKTTRPSVNKFM
ncbi:dynein regulatory complex protein 1 [Anabrus simplex]|uniref:dynein regulatory complex protein 1 n=1 Tax=Anabrus simplex TaxID=316456 RepID=UPI0035A31A0E